MITLPHSLYTAEQSRALDRRAIESLAVSGYELMQRAGHAAFDVLCRHWPDARRIAVVCGTGNNGGDGMVVARLAHAAGLEVRLYLVGEVSRLAGEALQAYQALGEALSPQPLPESLVGYDMVVDALLGTGLQGELKPAWRTAIEIMNASGAPVLALDVPSGLHADTGASLGAAVCARATVCFIGLKQGLLTGEGPGYTGRLYFAGLGLPSQLYDEILPTARRIDYSVLCRLLPPRARTAHKGDNGHVLVIGGDLGMGGAVRLAAEGAARTGAGLVSVATRAAHAAVVCAQCPELMSHGVESPGELEALLARADVVVLGPGLGQGEWSAMVWQGALASGKPLVLDADGLNVLAGQPNQRANWVLTPHPGEAARLLGCSSADVQVDRFFAVRRLQQCYGGVVVLKGPGTLVAAPDGMIALCSGGNPGMASGGMGDVLSGVIGALLGQGLAPRSAAELGVAVHATAADRAARAGERGLLASDLIAELRGLVNP